MPHFKAGPPRLAVIQADAVINQANPVSGTKYLLLDTTKNVRVNSLFAKVTWTVQPTPLELHLLIDGQVILISQANPATATNYYPYWIPDASGMAFTITIADMGRKAFYFECKSLKVEAETTGGTVSNLSARLKYNLLEP